MTRRGCLPGPRAGRTVRPGEAGTTLIGTVGVLAVAMLLGATALPLFQSQRDAIHASGAARHVAALVNLTRAEALKRGTHVALVFQRSGKTYEYAMFADGNDDGVRTGDISSGVDRQVNPWARIGDHFSRAALGIAPGVTDPDSGAPVNGSPLKIGGGSLLSFGPAGGATSGTVYIRGPANLQYAVRILGATGRSRVLQFDFRARRWRAA